MGSNHSANGGVDSTMPPSDHGDNMHGVCSATEAPPSLSVQSWLGLGHVYKADLHVAGCGLQPIQRSS